MGATLTLDGRLRKDRARVVGSGISALLDAWYLDLFCPARQVHGVSVRSATQPLQGSDLEYSLKLKERLFFKF